MSRAPLTDRPRLSVDGDSLIDFVSELFRSCMVEPIGALLVHAQAITDYAKCLRSYLLQSPETVR